MATKIPIDEEIMPFTQHSTASTTLELRLIPRIRNTFLCLDGVTSLSIRQTPTTSEWYYCNRGARATETFSIGNQPRYIWSRGLRWSGVVPISGWILSAIWKPCMLLWLGIRMVFSYQISIFLGVPAAIDNNRPITISYGLTEISTIRLGLKPIKALQKRTIFIPPSEFPSHYWLSQH
jgi:hypothetical protein